MSNSKTFPMIIGVAPTEEFESESLNHPWSAWTCGGIGYAANGAIIYNGVQVARAHSYGEGDIVGVSLNMNTHQVTFYLNALPQNLIWSDTARREHCDMVRFTQSTMFAAATFSPDLDEMDIYTTDVPSN